MRADDDFAFVEVGGRELVRAPPESGLEGAAAGNSILCEPTVANAIRLRAVIPALAPRPPGLRASFGFGDRLGLATPGHVAALRRAGSGVVPVFAQQSARELARTGRTFPEVLAAATWGAFRAKWFDGFAADADHLKQREDVEAAAAAGFVLFTLDPSDHLCAEAEALSAAELATRFAALPWDRLDDDPRALLARHRRPVDLGSLRLEPDEEEVVRAAVKFGVAVAHAAELARAVPAGAEIEISLDETSRPTTTFEHVLVAGALRRLGVRWTALAPRFPGAFEKGIEYRGSQHAFFESARRHAEVAALEGPYKLSLHSGSDKPSLYPLLADATGGLCHVKTAGTSYLEALRVAAVENPPLMHEIWSLARRRFARDRATYELTAEVRRAPGEELPDDELPLLLEDEHARRILHVTFGSVLADDRLGDGLRTTVAASGALYTAALERHLGAHLEALGL